MKRNSGAPGEEPAAKKADGIRSRSGERTWIEIARRYRGSTAIPTRSPRPRQEQKTVTKLKCKVCTKFKAQIYTRRNFSNGWIAGGESVRTSNIRDHARTDQHMHAMLLLKKERATAKGLGAASYAPIAQLLQGLSVDERAKLSKKFDVAYFVATEKLAFTKYPSICQLEVRHGVDIGTSYLNKAAGVTFCHFITESRRQDLRTVLTSAKLFSILMDRSTEKAISMMSFFWCFIVIPMAMIKRSILGRVFLTVARPQAVKAQDLFECLQSGLGQLGILKQ